MGKNHKKPTWYFWSGIKWQNTRGVGFLKNQADEEALRLKMSSPDDLEQRLKFLDPELSATHSRIDVLETICQANTDRIEALAKHQSKTDRGERPAQ